MANTGFNYTTKIVKVINDICKNKPNKPNMTAFFKNPLINALWFGNSEHIRNPDFVGFAYSNCFKKVLSECSYKQDLPYIVKTL